MNFLRDLKNWLLIAEAVAFLAGVYYYGKFRNTIFQWLVWYLGAIVLFELVGFILKERQQYNWIGLYYGLLVIPFEFLFLFIHFFRSDPGKRNRQIAAVSAIIYLIALVAEYTTNAFSSRYFLSLSYSTGNLLLLVLITKYFLQLLRSSEILKIGTSMQFYLCTGLLIFYLGTFPFFSLFNFLVSHYTETYLAYYRCMLVLDIIMYLTFAAGFKWAHPKSPSSSSV